MNWTEDDTELPLDIVHNSQWFDAGDGERPFLEENFLCYRFRGGTEEIIALVDLDEPYSALVMNPQHPFPLPPKVARYLGQRFERVEQSSRRGRVILWERFFD